MYILYLAKLKERGRPFFEGTGEDGANKVRLPQIALSLFFTIFALLYLAWFLLLCGSMKFF